MQKDNLELSVTRLIDAPPETVYRAWIGRPDDWFAPKPWTTPPCSCPSTSIGFTRMPKSFIGKPSSRQAMQGERDMVTPSRTTRR